MRVPVRVQVKQYFLTCNKSDMQNIKAKLLQLEMSRRTHSQNTMTALTASGLLAKPDGMRSKALRHRTGRS